MTSQMESKWGPRHVSARISIYVDFVREQMGHKPTEKNDCEHIPYSIPIDRIRGVSLVHVSFKKMSGTAVLTKRVECI